MERTSVATNSSIVLEAMKELVGELLLHLDGVPLKTLNIVELLLVLNKCKYFSSPNIRNEVTSFKYLRRFGIMNNITKLRGTSTWAFLQENKFPGQGSDMDKVFVFKILEVGPSSGVDLVKQMQLGRDLQSNVLRVGLLCHVMSMTPYIVAL